MAILHGSWVMSLPKATPSPTNGPGAADGYFFLWGEVWRRVDPIAPEADALLAHPYTLGLTELLDWLRSLQQAHQLRWPIDEVPLQAPTSAPAKGRRKSAPMPLEQWIPDHRRTVVSLLLPTYHLSHPDHETPGWLPQHSAALDLPLEEGDGLPTRALSFEPWAIEGLVLTADDAVQLLNSLPLNFINADDAFVGGDLRYWSHVSRWGLDLLARSKVIPLLERTEPEAAIARWQALVDSSMDQERVLHFAKRMPGVCRAYARPLDGAEERPSIPSVRSLLFSFLHSSIDAQVRTVAQGVSIAPTTPLPQDMPLREWLAGLAGDRTLQAPADQLARLDAILSNWVAPLQRYLDQDGATFRTCFHLQPPTQTGEKDWSLDYALQAMDDPEVLVDAKTIWSNPVDRLLYQDRIIDQPQETLLAGLGLASRLFPLIDQSLMDQQPLACALNPLQVYEFIKSTAWRLQDNGFGVILPPSLASQDGWANRLGLSIQAATPKKTSGKKGLGLKNLLNFKWELTIGGQRLSKAEFDRLVALNTPLVEINGEWVELRPQDVKAAQTFFENRKDQMSLSLEDALRISTGDTQVIEKLPVLQFEASGALEELINSLTTGNQSVQPISIPDSFAGELRPYQLRGASWLAFLQRWGLGACLADDMGLGKTVQFIALMLYLQAQEALDSPVLLVCPTSVLGNWEREVKRFGPSLQVLIHHGDKRSQAKEFAKAVKGNHLVITSYALIYRDEKELNSVSWQGVVLDEAQNIKNAESRQSQAIRQIDADFRIALTGTPVENRLTELWSIMDFLNPGYLGPKNFFQRRFAIPIERYGDSASMQTLRSLVQPFILRRLKTDRSIIQDLPEKQEMTVFCGLSAEQAAIYQKLVEQSLVAIESAEGIQRKGMILGLLTKLKQICNHPDLYRKGDGDEDAEEDSVDIPLPVEETGFQAKSGKLQRLSEMLEELLAEGDRTLIFTQFAQWGKLLKAHLEQQLHREVLFLYGGTPRKQREEMVDRFQNDPQGPRVFILSLKAGGVGLNLTRANHVFHFDRWWNPAVENQATDRVFRIGQTRNVQVHKFVCTGTLEERIHELIESKRALAEQIVGAGENWLTELDTDSLRTLLLLDRSAIIDEADGG